MQSDRHRAERLLENEAWLRSLARSLVRDPGVAEDSIQDTWIAALQSPPQAPGSLRGWLATVLQRSMAGRRRRDERRAHREARFRVDRGERAAPAADELAMEVEARRALLDAVESLDPDEAELVSLAFFQDHSGVEIARRLGVSTKTVQRRTKAVLERLRRRIDRRDSRGLATLGPLVLPFADSSRLPLWIMTTKTKLTFASVAVVALALVGWRTLRPDEPTSPSSETALGAMESADRETLSTEPVTTAPREPLANAEVPTDEAVAAPFRSRVLDLEGRGFPGANVRVLDDDDEPRAVVATSEFDGTYQLVLGDRPLRVVADSPGHAPVVRAYVREGGDDQATLVLAPAVTYAGVVVDEHGVGLGDVPVTLYFDDLWSVGLPDGYGDSERLWSGTRTSEDGAFELVDVPGMIGSRLLVKAEGEQQMFPVPATSRRDLVLAFAPEPREYSGRAARWKLTGRLLDSRGEPVAGGKIALDDRRTKTDANGRFETTVATRHARSRLVATHREHILVVDLDPSASHLELTLPAEAHPWIEGTLFDEHGEPIERGQVSLLDPTSLLPGSNSIMPAYAEARLGSLGARTDERGRFRLPVLPGRNYAVQARCQEDRRRLIEPAVAAGTTGLVLRFDEPARVRTIRGRVVDPRGDAVPGAHVVLQQSVNSGGSIGVNHAGETTADAEGRFEIPGVDAWFNGVEYQATGFVKTERSFEADVDFEQPIELVLRRRVRMRLELSSAGRELREFQLLDGARGVVPLAVYQRYGDEAAEGATFTRLARLRDGRSKCYTVPEGSYELRVWFTDGAEASVPIELEPGPTAVIRAAL